MGRVLHPFNSRDKHERYIKFWEFLVDFISVTLYLFRFCALRLNARSDQEQNVNKHVIVTIIIIIIIIIIVIIIIIYYFVWQYISVYLFDAIESIQRRALRTIFPNSSYHQALDQANLTSLANRRIFISKKLMANMRN